MPEDIRPRAEQIPQTGEPTWFPPEEDDAEALLKHQQPNGLRWVFFGADGLRAGWSLLLFLLVMRLLAFTYKPFLQATGMLKYAPRHGEATRWMQPFLFSHGIPLIYGLLAAWAVSLLEKRRMGQYGAGFVRGWGKQFATGLLWGVTLFSLLVFALRASHLLVFDARILYGTAMLQWGVAWALSFLCVGLSEEYLMRGFLQFTLARGCAGIAGLLGAEGHQRRAIGFWIASIITSVLFALLHITNSGEGTVGVWAAGLIGFVFTYSLWRTGSLWWAIGWHAAWDWAESFLFGTVDSGSSIQHSLVISHPTGSPILSGGLTGPEGSVFVFAIIALTAGLIALTLPSQPGSPSDPAYSPNLDVPTR